MVLAVARMLQPVGYHLYRYVAPSYVRVSVHDAATMKRVFFSGEPWIVWCERDARVPPTFEEAAFQAYLEGDDVNYASMDCDAPLPSSGVSVVKRFKLDKALASMQAKRTNDEVEEEEVGAFVVANGGKPRPLLTNWFPDDVEGQILDHNALNLKRLAISKTRPSSLKAVKTRSDLDKACWSRKRCAVLLIPKAKISKAQKELFKRIRLSQRNVRFVRIDASRFHLSLRLPDTNPGVAKWPRLVYFERAHESGKVHAKVHRGPITHDAVGEFLDLVKNRNEDGALAVQLATIKTPRLVKGATPVSSRKPEGDGYEGAEDDDDEEEEEEEEEVVKKERKTRKERKKKKARKVRKVRKERKQKPTKPKKRDRPRRQQREPLVRETTSAERDHVDDEEEEVIDLDDDVIDLDDEEEDGYDEHDDEL